MSATLDIFPLSHSGYIADTQHLSLTQHGAYLLIMMTMRRAGGWITDDEQNLANICKISVAKWRKIAPELRALFMVKDGKITQKRVLIDVEKTLKTVNKNKQNGSAGGKAKSLKNNKPKVATATVSPPDRQPQDENAMSSFLPSLDIRKEDKKKKNSGIALPPDWKPAPSDIEYGKRLSLDIRAIEGMAEDLRLWARANSHRAIGRKADWSATFHGWMRREAGKHRQKTQSRTSNGFAQSMLATMRDDDEEDK